MLEFLVLGQVPGTQIYISFTGYLIVAFCVFSLLLAVIHKPKKQQTESAQNGQLSLFN